jgi:DNA end-binding protein Ku
MARSIWKGSISFGLVNIPVTLYSGEERSEKLSFNMLDKRDMQPLGYKRVNKTTGEEVAWGDIVKAYEFEKGSYVIVEDEDFQKAYPVASQTVEILDFVDAAEIEALYYDKPYFLEPGKKGEKGYALLRETLERTGKAGIAKVVVRTKQYLCAVLPRGPALVLEALRFAHELRDPAELNLPPADLEKAGVSDREVEMATRLVEGMVAAWEPEKYRDDYTEEMLEIIRRKAREGEIEVLEEAAEEDAEASRGDVVDFTALLKRSLEVAKTGERPGKRSSLGEDAKPAVKSRKAGAVKLASAKKAAAGGARSRKKTATRKRASG